MWRRKQKERKQGCWGCGGVVSGIRSTSEVLPRCVQSKSLVDGDGEDKMVAVRVNGSVSHRSSSTW